MQSIEGVSHVTLTVTDLERAKRFWTEVMGLELAAESEEHIVCIDRESRLAVGSRTHPGGREAGFDERNVGLDHLAIDVADVASLERWEERLARHGVERSPIVESSWGWHLNLRAPERIALELQVIRPEVAAALFGPVSLEEELPT